MSLFYVVATPIGNLADISKRALQILSRVDLILCEDTRVTKKLLNYYNIKTPVLSYHQHSKLNKVNKILNYLKNGKNLALVSDAGTPTISDPGSKLIKKIIESLGEKVKIIPLPGPSALLTAASISGFPMDKFVFLGFPPAKRKRKRFFLKVINSDYPVIFYESPHRIIKTLLELKNLYYQIFPSEGFPETVVCRELTKKFETIYRGEIEKIIEKIKKNGTRGEFVVIFSAKKKKK